VSEDGGPVVPGVPGGASVPPAPGGGTAQVPGDRAAALAAYLEVNRGRYTEGALRRAANSAGYSDAEFKAAWAAGPVATTGEGAPSRPRLRIAIPVAIVYVAVVYLAVSFLGSRADYDLTMPAIILAGIVGLGGWVVLREQRPSLAMGLGLGLILAIVLPIVLLLVLLGMCIVAGGNPIVPGG
jgi:hypothetical protein